MRSLHNNPLTRSFLALLTVVLLGGSSLQALEIIDPCLDPLADCWSGPVIEIPVDLPKPGDDTPETGLGPFIAQTIDPTLIELRRRVDGGQANNNDDGGSTAVRAKSRVQWVLSSQEVVSVIYHELSHMNEGDTSSSSYDSPYGPVVVRILGREIVLLDCEGIAGPLGGAQPPLGDGGGAMQMGLSAKLLVEVRHLDMRFALRFPLNVNVCKDEATVATNLRRANVRRPFRRGYVDGAEPTVTSAVKIFSHLFLGGDGFGCEDEADINADDEITLADGVKLLDHLFRGGERPVEPFLREDFAQLDTQLQCDEPNFEGIVADRRPLPDLDILLGDLLNPGACTSATRGMTKCIDGLEHICNVENGFGSWVQILPAQACSDVLGGGLPPILDTETP